MTLSKAEAQKLQEGLILIYKTIHQNRMANSFYFQGLESQNSSSQLINRINELENPEEVLKVCIIELEEIKEKKKLKMENFNGILDDYDISFLKRKYYIREIKDFDNLDVEELLSLL
ncbi:MAG: hypothetical protein ACXVHM_01980 [Methanobacterium sp.]